MFYTKEVSVNSVLIVDGTSPRTKIDNSRIAFFREIYSQKKEDLIFEIPPVEVSLVQTGDPGKEVFALEDGVHRLLAQKEIKMKKIKARIRTDISISESELNTYEVKKHLLMKACESNASHGMALSNEERKDAVQKMNIYGCTGAEIIATGIAGKATIYRWLQNEVKERKVKAVCARVSKKEQVKTLLVQGASVKKIINETGVSRTTARRLINEVTKKHPNDNETVAASITDNNGPTYKWKSVEGSSNALDAKENESDGKNTEERSEPSVECETASASAQKSINEIYDAIRLLEVNDATDHEIKITVLPLLAKKFPGVAGIIKDGSYAMEMEGLHYELKAAKEELQIQRKELLKKNDQLKQKEELLKKRTEACNYQCEFTTERLRLEFEKYVSFMVTHINEHIQAIPDVSEKDGGILKQLTVNSIFALLSVLEWGDDNGLTSLRTKEKFEDFKDSINGMDINNNGINSRIISLEKIYGTMSGMQQSSNWGGLLWSTQIKK